jgi:acyl-CoA reductase-like NAD-dependent aldehyde dehydrogenase
MALRTWNGLPVVTKDPEKGLALARRIRTGNVTVNGLNLQGGGPVRRLQGVRHRPRGRAGGA